MKTYREILEKKIDPKKLAVEIAQDALEYKGDSLKKLKDMKLLDAIISYVKSVDFKSLYGVDSVSDITNIISRNRKEIFKAIK